LSRYVGEYFEKLAHDFDSYYERPNSVVSWLINEWLRKPGLLKRLEVALTLTEPRPGLKVLDVGCGSGKFVAECAKAGAEVTGIDISPEMIKLAINYMEMNRINANLFVGDATERLPNKYDICVALGVIEYFKDPMVILRNMIEASQSKVIFSVPKQFAFQVPLREIMLNSRGVDCYYYTKKKVIKMADEFDKKSITVHDCGPVYVACIELK
jgi:2-polyprenyl-3-methyl-5-hydroxy-6-metoxy-1,4-benzoquinol methylase